MSLADSIPVTTNAAEHASDLTLSTVLESSAWIVQGVSPRNDHCRMHEENDAIWYTRTVNELLCERIDDWDQSLDDIMHDVVCSVIDRYASSVDNFRSIDLDTLPSAMVSCIRWDGNDGEADTVEYFNLGDCVTTFELGFDTCRICATDGSLHTAEYDANDQWRLSFNPGAVEYARHGSLDSHDIHGVHLYPTAVDAAAEVYEMFSDTDALLTDAAERDTESLLGDIREMYATQTHDQPLSTRPGVQDLSLISLTF